MSDTATVTKEITKTKLKEPKKFKVIILNDDTTPMDFVVSILMNIFNHSEAVAKELMLQVHTEGAAVAGIFPYEIADQKVNETRIIVEQHRYDLQVELEQA